MNESAWSYSMWRDDIIWKLLVAGLAGAIPGVLLLFGASRIASAGGLAEGKMLAVLFMIPSLLLLLWTSIMWGMALRRVRRMRRLINKGVRVLARVRESRLLRGKNGVLVGVVVGLDYEHDGLMHQTTKRTTRSGVAGRARENAQLEILVDPEAPHVTALLIDGTLA